MAKALYLVVLVAVILNVTVAQFLSQVDADSQAKAKRHAEECVKELGVSKEYVIALRNGEWDQAEQDVKCFIECYLKKNNAVYKDGEITQHYLDFVKKHLKVDIDELKKRCADKMKFTECRGAFEAFKCFHDMKATVL